MKTFTTVLVLVVLLVGMVAAPAEAWGRGRHHFWGPAAVLAAPLIVAGALVATPFIIAQSAIAAATPPPVAAPVVVSPPAPVVVAPRPVAPVVAAPAPQGYWYYCAEPAGYHPYVRRCSVAWITVVPPAGPPGVRY